MGSLPSKKEKTPLQIDPSTKRLDLRNKGIKNLKKVPELPELVWLNLPNNEIRLLPKHAGSLYPILQTLRLMSNQLSEIPASFATMRHLVSIDLGKNRFTNFPLVLCEILSLTDLSLQFNKIETVCTLASAVLIYFTFVTGPNRVESVDEFKGLKPVNK